MAEHLAAGEVVAAALVDHDTTEGFAEFSHALARREIASIPGIEVTVQFRGKEAHLLAYGIDPSHGALQATLFELRQARAADVQSVVETLRKKSPTHEHAGAPLPPGGKLESADAIALVHDAGGRAFLAHPLTLTNDLDELEQLLITLKGQGLDGIEAIYSPYTDEQRQRLCEIAKRLGLLVSAGTDAHDRHAQGASAGIDMPTDLWKAFRDAVYAGNQPAARATTPAPVRARTRFQRRKFIFHFVFPSFLAVALFITAIYAIILPTFERSLLDRKREMIRELTNSAWSILAGLERDERAGRLTREQAQAMAISRIESLRYGREGKDYFWLQDETPRIIMHPYRKDLNGQDVANVRDPRGVAIFVEFAEVVRRGEEGYVEYVWQWKDDPSRLEPKESYLKGFEPWGWIIGTGIYIEDVKAEIQRIERSLVQTSLVISIIVVLLLLYVVVESLRLERERTEAVESLQDSTERYRSLVEATTEGTLLVIDGRCRYANPIFLSMVGASLQELELRDLIDLFPVNAENALAWENLNRLLQGEEMREGFDGMLRRRDGKLLECVCTANRISFAGRSGFILLARSIGPTSGAERVAMRNGHEAHLPQVAEGSQVGLFRARASSRGTLLAFNPATLRLLTTADGTDGAQAALADLFPTPAEYEDFYQELQRAGSAERHLPVTTHDPGSRMVALSATLTVDEHGKPRYIDGVVEDITLQQQRAAEQAAVIEKLQTSLLFLHEPVKRLEGRAVFCRYDTPIHTATAMMTEQRSSAALVQSEDSSVIGIVTDGDIRQRVVAADLSRREPVHRIMTSPLVTIDKHAEIYQALLLMEQRNIHHLAVADETGRVTGVIRNQELLQFRNYGPIVLTREVEGAATPEEVVRNCRRVPEMVRALLECGAHPERITRMISAVCNAATVRLIALAEEELGPVPTPFVLLALGSQGRQEMTLASDQDNAILYDLPPGADNQLQVEEYLQALGRFVCTWLDRAGYPLCRGDVMAQNPRWCQPLSVWKRYFGDWIQRAEAQQLLEFSIFFDFNPLYGPEALTHELRRHIDDLLRARPAFFPHIAQNALLFKPPTRLFGRILGGEQPGQLDLKDALMPIISFARLYALRHELEATHTLHRLQLLAEADVLTESSRRDIAGAYEFLMRLRLQQQAAAIATGQSPDNLLNYRRLTQAEHTLLNQSFALIEAIQKRISYDFLGGTA
jgi:PAS domain S-box-containing protein